MLAKKVPGLAAGTGTSSIFGQSFHGRNVSVLIDGVPQSTGRNVMRDFETIAVSAIERVEVLGGATAIYGDGATGAFVRRILHLVGTAVSPAQARDAADREPCGTAAPR